MSSSGVDCIGSIDGVILIVVFVVDLVVEAVASVGKYFVKFMSSMNIVPCAELNALLREKSTLS